MINKEIQKIIKSKPMLDIFETVETNDDTDYDSVRQSEVNVELKTPEDFNKLFDKGKEVMKGYLMKRNPWFVNQKRLFILTSHPKLIYFKDDKNLRGEIRIWRGTKVKKVWKYKFEVETPKRTYYLRHPDKGSVDVWVQAINDLIKENYGN